MSKNLTSFTLRALIFLLCVSVEAQQTSKVPRIGYLLETSPSGGAHLFGAFRQGLRDLGYIEGKNIFIESRWAEQRRERLIPLAAELVRLNVDVIVAAPAPVGLVVKQATSTIPIVVAHMSDPEELGLVTNLARPGGNVTGMRSLTSELGVKRLEILKEAFPKISRVVVLPGAGGPEVAREAGLSQEKRVSMKMMEAAAQTLGLELRLLHWKPSDPDFRGLFRAMVEMSAGAFTVTSSPVPLHYLAEIVDLPRKSRIPAIYPQSQFAEAGGLMSYGARWEDFHRRAAYYVDKILKGAKPADLPVEQPTKFEFVINLKTAKTLGLTIPPQVLMEADRVIK